MNHDLYIFGSAVRGEVSSSSDIDVLVIPLGNPTGEYPRDWSVYSPETIESYFHAGRLFAWHLHLEAKCIHFSGPSPYLSTLGSPAPYSSVAKDIDDLDTLLQEALLEIQSQTSSLIYELGIVYTAIRDIAMAASWALMGRPCFSRNAPYLIPRPCPLPQETYWGAMLARHSSTRGNNHEIEPEQLAKVLISTPIHEWIRDIKSAI